MSTLEATLNSFSLKDLLDDRVKPSDKKSQIISEAIKVFMENGYYKTKMEMIAQKVGIGKSTIYEYFPSKQALFYEAIFYVNHNFYQDLRQQLEKESDPEKQLKIVIMSYLLFCKVLNRLTEVIDHMDEIPIDMKKDVLASWQQSNDLLESILQRGIQLGKFRQLNTTLTAKILTGTLLSSHIYFAEGNESLPKMMDEMYGLIQKGIAQV